jgi:hypothetical protein
MRAFGAFSRRRFGRSTDPWRRLMAHEYMLKMLVDGLANSAHDFQTFATLLNQRAELHGVKTLFGATEYQAPGPKYPSKEESSTRAAEAAVKVADNYQLVVAYFRITSQPPEPLDPASYDEEGLLQLILSWQVLGAGAFKAIVNLYGEMPAPPPPSSLPGAASELRLWAEVAAWLEKLASDSTLFSVSQQLTHAEKSRPKKVRPAPMLGSLARLEHALHRTTADSLLVANVLPYHLYRAAHKKR